MDGLAIAASLTELRAAVEGGFIRSVYEPIPGLVIFHVFADKKRRIFVSPRRSSVHATELDIPNPERPSTFAMQMRKHLRGARIREIRQVGLDRVVEWDVVRRDADGIHDYQIILELIGLRGNVILLKAGRVVGALRTDARCRLGDMYQPLPAQPRTPFSEVDETMIRRLLDEEQPERALAGVVDGLSRRSARDALSRQAIPDMDLRAVSVRETLQEMFESIANPQGHFDPDLQRAAPYPLASPAVPTRTFAEAVDREIEGSGLLGQEEREDRALRTRLQKEIGRRKRTAKKLEDWLAAASEADRMGSHADLLMTYHREVPRKARTVTLEDPASATPVHIVLDPSLSAIENAQKLYEKAKRMRRGVPRVVTRLERLRGEVMSLEEGLEGLGRGEDLPETLVRLLSLDAKPKSKPKQATAPSLRTIDVEGYAILVGRSAAENDRLLRAADPEDLWMHVRRYAGSHVFIRTRGANQIPDGVLRAAAQLAGRNSKAGQERRVEVTVARVKHVRKPKGAPPGLVIVDRADTLTVDLEKEEER